MGVISRRSLLRENAYRWIRDAIVDATLAPGERLNDAELAEWLGVSRTPVREALTRLEESGLVQTEPGRYTMVSPLDADAARAAQSVTAAMHELAVREPVPAPVTTIAWRLAHVIVPCLGCRVGWHFGGQDVDSQTFGYAGTVDEALKQLDEMYGRWNAGRPYRGR